MNTLMNKTTTASTLHVIALTRQPYIALYSICKGPSHWVYLGFPRSLAQDPFGTAELAAPLADQCTACWTTECVQEIFLNTRQFKI